MFTVYSDSRSDSTMVSNLFIDEYMKNANDAQIKVYLYLLRMTGAHRTTSISDMADLFNHTEKDVVRSLRYWEQKGLLDLTFKGEDDLVSIRLCRPAAIREAPDPALRVLPFSSQAGTSLTLDRQLAAGGSTLQIGSRSAYAACSSGSPVIGRPDSNTSRNSGGITARRSGGIAGSRSGGIAGSSREDRSGSFRKQRPAEGGTPAGEKKPADLLALESFRLNPGRKQLLFVIEQYIGKRASA